MKSSKGHSLDINGRNMLLFKLIWRKNGADFLDFKPAENITVEKKKRGNKVSKTRKHYVKEKKNCISALKCQASGKRKPYKYNLMQKWLTKLILRNEIW